jgi:hypothetical protein
MYHLIGKLGYLIEQTPEDNKSHKGKDEDAYEEKWYVLVCKYVMLDTKIQESEYRKKKKEAENDIQLVGEVTVSKRTFSQPFI